MSTDNAASENVKGLVDLDRVIHEPARLVIVAILSAVESADFVYLQRETELTPGNLSSHLARLESAGYVELEKGYRGKVPLTTCRLTAEGRRAFAEYRTSLEEVLADRS